MRGLLARALVPLLAVGLLTGCGGVVVIGTPTPGKNLPSVVPSSSFPITGASNEPIDLFARNALTDLNTFWSTAYPTYFGGRYRPLSGGYFSVDSKNPDQSAYPSTGIGCARAPASPDSVAGNAFYDPGCDSIAYDRSLLEELSGDYGRFLVA